MPAEHRLLVFVPADRGLGRTTGVAGKLNIQTGGMTVYSETTWWPLGWIVILNDAGDTELPLEVTSWMKEPFDRKRALDLRIPVLSARYWAGLDFRTQAEMDRDERRNLGLER